MLRNPINRNSDASTGGATATETVAAVVEASAAPVVKGFDALSEMTGIGVSTEAPAATETTAAATTEATTETTASTEAAAAQANEQVKLDEKGNQVNEKGEIVKTKEQLDIETPITEFKIEGATAAATTETPEELARKTALEDLAKESSWVNLAKLHGATITENTIEAYEAGIKEKNTAREAELLKVAEQSVKDKLLTERPVEAMVILEGLDAGLTIEQILQPKKEIEALEALSHAELISKDCELRGWPQDMIDKYIADLTENDKLDITAQPLRDLLSTNKEAIDQKQLEQIAALKQSKATKEAEARVRDSEEIKNTIVSMKNYMGVPIDEKVVNHIVQKWNKNEYHEAFTDPKVIAEFLMYKEFGAQGLKALENRAYQRGRDEKAMKLHNVPPVVQTGGKAATTQTVKPEGNFGALPNPSN